MIQQLIITIYANFKERGIKANFPAELIIIQIVFPNSFFFFFPTKLIKIR